MATSIDAATTATRLGCDSWAKKKTLLYLSGSNDVPLLPTQLEGALRHRIHKRVAAVVNLKVVKGEDITCAKRKSWKARPPKWLLAFIDAVKQSCRQQDMELVVVGFSRGSMWLSLLAHLIGVDDGPIADRMAMIGHYPEPGKTEDQLQEEAAQIKCPLLMLSSRSDKCCPLTVSAPYIAMVQTQEDHKQIGHKTHIVDHLTHEQLLAVVCGKLDKAYDLTTAVWDFILG